MQTVQSGLVELRWSDTGPQRIHDLLVRVEAPALQ